MINLPQPNISDAADAMYIQKYLYRLVESLNYVLNGIENGGEDMSWATTTLQSMRSEIVSLQNLYSGIGSIRATSDVSGTFGNDLPTGFTNGTAITVGGVYAILISQDGGLWVGVSTGGGGWTWSEK